MHGHKNVKSYSYYYVFLYMNFLFTSFQLSSLVLIVLLRKASQDWPLTKKGSMSSDNS
jgi:hypothetical protein